ncbi:hypothetical protein CPC08DRAFT_756770 [Agrocybe pediades]|nr:hypothetical protein CPC08DRAFT_756770 [Agrocybe pediades]
MDDAHNQKFAEAIANRFSNSPILPIPPSSQMQDNSFPPLDTAHLNAWLDDPATLVVDIRPHAAFSSARIPHAISLSVPSTLLKRPLFSLQRLSAMLPSLSARNRFSSWSSASRILVYDADSAFVGESSNIAGLLRKFKNDGFTGDLAWLKGGFQAAWRDCRNLVDTSPPSPDNEGDEEEDDQSKSSVLRTRQLPMAAFSLSSTTVHNSPHFNSAAAPPPQNPSKNQMSLPRPTSNSITANSHSAFNPFFDTIRQNTELSHGITERITLRLPRRVRRRIPELPFPWLQDIARKAASAPDEHHHTSESSSSESEDDDGVNPADVEEGKEALAMQFFKIELSEQRRLMGIMEHHSKESGQFVAHATTTPFPYSITAGVEKGAKNRYRHIWPFEHARVRLHQKRETDDDYINASYIQPLGTNKRYIATQGPLPATFTDFWTLCWEQNVHVIVMLTREVEGAMVKCGAYWTDTDFGPLRLRLVSTEGLPPPDEHPATAGYFNDHSSLSSHSSRPPPRRFPHSAGSQRHYRHHHYHTRRSETVKRVFELTHTGYPEAKPRQIIHLQYLEWPDMNVPDDPRGVLGLVKQVEDAANEAAANDQCADPKKNRRQGDRQAVSMNQIDEMTGIAKHALGTQPVLLHCSAGVGRTGGFIAVDAVLDAIRREIRSNISGNKSTATPEQADMDVDTNEAEQSSIPTIALPLSSGFRNEDNPGTDKLEKMSSSLSGGSGLVVHVPLATPMQVDEPPENKAGLSGMASGTKRWAENVRDETDGNAGVSSGQKERTRVSSASSGFFSMPGSSSVGSSSEAANNGSYYYNSSSSFGTSVSGTSSSYVKANFPTTSIPAASANVPSTTSMKDTASELLQAVLNSQQNAAQHRMRTISAPAAHMAPLGSPAIRGRFARFDGASRSSLSLSLADSSTSNAQNEDNSRNTRRLAKPPTLSFDFSNTSPFKQPSTKASNPGALSSDGEPPSRSQSPSADESNYPQPVPRSDNLLLDHPALLPVNSSVVAERSSSPATGAVQAKSFDYKEPRRLHEDKTPPPLSSFDDPIWEVVQDMREQRMSLCQSLRQYVFVHAAIIEGSLMVLDEEKEIAEGLKPRALNDNQSGSSPTTAMSDDAVSSSQSQSRSPSSASRSKGYTHPYSSQEVAAAASSSSLSIGKRGASPTELTKEDVEGELMLSKRPSIKRKQRSGEDMTKAEEHARYHPVPLRVSSSVLHSGNVSAPSARAMPP